MPVAMGAAGSAAAGSGGSSAGSAAAAGAAGQATCGSFEPPAVPEVDAAVAARYRWSECGLIAPSALSLQAIYAADGSILSLDERGRVQAFAADSTAPPVTLVDSVQGPLVLSNDGTQLLTWESGEAVVYQASQGAIGATSGALSRFTGIAAASCDATTPNSFPLIAFSADGALVVALGEHKACASTVTGDQVASVVLDTPPEAPGWPTLIGAESGAASLTLFRGGLLQRYAFSGERLTSFDVSQASPPGASPNDAALSADARTLLVLFPLPTSDFQLLALDTHTGSIRWQQSFASDWYPPQLSVSNDGYVLASDGGVYAIEDGARVSGDRHAFSNRGATLGSRGLKKLVPGDQIGEWDETQQKLLRLYGAHDQDLRALEVSADGRYLGSNGVWSIVWELADDFSQSIPRYNGVAPDSSWNVALAPDGSAMVASGDNVGYFQLGGGFVPNDVPPSALGVGCLSADWAFSPDGCWTAGTHYDRRVQIHDAHDFSFVTTLDTHDCQGGVAFSPDGAYLMTANLELFSTKSWQHLASFATTPNPDVTRGGEDAVAFSPNGREVLITRRIATTASPEYISTRYGVGGGLIGPVPLAGDRPRYSPEGQWLVSAGRALHLPSGTTVDFDPDATVSVFTPQGDIIAGKSDGSLVRYCRSSQ